MKIMLVFGTRPEAIKMCPLASELKKRAGVKTLVCVTGQHRGMLDSVLSAFGIVPDFDLDIMKQSQTLFDITSAVLERLKAILINEKPDVVLVHGDTSTAFSAALACFYLKIPVGHVEAGLRTYDIQSPYPEEFNRQSIDSLSDYLFAPTEVSKSNLLREGKDERKISVTGNTGIDALKTTVRADFSHPVLDFAKGRRLVFITAHRRENLGEPMRGMFRAIKRVLNEQPDVCAVYPVHPNPEVRKAAEEAFSDCGSMLLTEPFDVITSHNIMARSFLVLTDSGGIQEEAPALGIPVLVMRDTTERPEGVTAGTLKLVGTDEENVYRQFSLLLDDSAEYGKTARAVNPYGDGTASVKIADILTAGIDK